MHLETLKVFCDVVETRSFSDRGLPELRHPIRREPAGPHARGALRAPAPRTHPRQRPAHARRARSSTKRARRSCSGIREHGARLQAVAKVVGGTVRVATVHSVGLYELSAPLKRYLKAYPAGEPPPRVQPARTRSTRTRSGPHRPRHRRLSRTAAPASPSSRSARIASCWSAAGPSARAASLGVDTQAVGRGDGRLRARHPDPQGDRPRAAAATASTCAT